MEPRNKSDDDSRSFAAGFSAPPHTSPVQPVELRAEDRVRFRCHPGIACFNECCRSIDITLTPYDIIRLKRHLGLDSKEFVARFTLPFEMDAHGMPGLKLRTKPGGSECVFLGAEGCTVYADRPAACRYYALGSMGVRRKDSATVEDIYFLVKEPHCLGHQEDRTLTVAEYREEQGITEYDEANRTWREIVLKKRSSGPTVGKPSARSLQLFDMCSYDMDSFRTFIRSPGFRELFALDDDTIDGLANDETALLAFAMRFLAQVLFGERTIAQRPGAAERRRERRRRRQAEAERAALDGGGAGDE